MSLITWWAHTLPRWPSLSQSIAAQYLAWQMHRWAECQITGRSWTKNKFLMEPKVAAQAVMFCAFDRNHQKLFWAEQLDIALYPSVLSWKALACVVGKKAFLSIKTIFFLPHTREWCTKLVSEIWAQQSPWIVHFVPCELRWPFRVSYKEEIEV